jgi:hypothetical protein
MFRKLAALATASVASLALILPVGIASAQTTAYTTSFTTSVTYQNVGTGTATVSFQFYPQGSSTAVTFNSSLGANAGSSLFIGNVTGISSGFSGSGVISSDQPVVATLVQVPASASAVKNRPLTNGFDSSAGATKFLLPTVLKNNFNTTTQFSVQNVDSAAANVTVKFFAVGNTNAVYSETYNNLPPGSSKYWDAGTISQLGSTFNGSVTVEATGRVVASALELSTNGTAASGFDGVSSGANTFYMASALCDFGAAKNRTSYAVQNTDSANTANVTVTYSNGATQSASVAPGGKSSFVTCNATGMTAGFNGSATITSTGAQIAAIGKVGQGGLSTAFNGAATGSSKLALPYIRWSESRFNTGNRDRQRAFIAIQNIGGPLAAGEATVKYYDKTGALVGTQSLGAMATGGKTNSNPFSAIGAAAAEFGYYSDNTTGGSAIVEGPAGSQLVAVVRIQSAPASGNVGEDYNGIAVQ